MRGRLEELVGISREISLRHEHLLLVQSAIPRIAFNRSATDTFDPVIAGRE